MSQDTRRAVTLAIWWSPEEPGNISVRRRCWQTEALAGRSADRSTFLQRERGCHIWKAEKGSVSRDSDPAVPPEDEHVLDDDGVLKDDFSLSPFLLRSAMSWSPPAVSQADIDLLTNLNHHLLHAANISRSIALRWGIKPLDPEVV